MILTWPVWNAERADGRALWQVPANSSVRESLQRRRIATTGSGAKPLVCGHFS
jgi:hypothetical protein